MVGWRNLGEGIRPPWGIWRTHIVLNSGPVRTYVVSLALHAIRTIALMRIAGSLFDSRRDGPWLLSRSLRAGRQY